MEALLQHYTILWNAGYRVRSIIASLASICLSVGTDVNNASNIDDQSSSICPHAKYHLVKWGMWVNTVMELASVHPVEFCCILSKLELHFLLDNTWGEFMTDIWNLERTYSCNYWIYPLVVCKEIFCLFKKIQLMGFLINHPRESSVY